MNRFLMIMGLVVGLISIRLQAAESNDRVMLPSKEEMSQVFESWGYDYFDAKKKFSERYGGKEMHVLGLVTKLTCELSDYDEENGLSSLPHRQQMVFLLVKELLVKYPDAIENLKKQGLPI